MTKPHIAILGTGRMGTVLATALRDHGHEVTVWNRTRARAEPLAALGAHVAESVLEAVTRADVVIGIVFDYPSFEALVASEQVTRALRGKQLIQLTSGSPAQARKSADWARERGIHYLDGAIMAPPELIGQSSCLILYAGQHAAFEQHKGWLVALAGNSVHVGDDVGQAGALDSALLLYYWGALFGVAHGAVIAEAEGISLDVYRGHIAALNPVIGESVLDLIGRVARKDFDNTSATIETHHGALLHLRAIGDERGLDNGVPDAFFKLLDAAVKRGDSQRDFAAVSSLIRRAR